MSFLVSFQLPEDHFAKQIIKMSLMFSPTGELFAQAPVNEFPGIAVETVSDSSRYFVLRIQDDNGG